MDDAARRLEIVERENDLLRERVAMLERVFLSTDVAERLPIEWLLTGQEAIVMGVLVGREVATKEMIYTALYQGRLIDGDDREPKIVDAFICKIRKKLKPWEVGIRTIWGRGYSLDPLWRQKLLVHRSTQPVAA
jgi:two-component system cell cycle response regulator CtrA